MAEMTAASSTGPNASIPPTVTKFATKPKPLQIVESGYWMATPSIAECAFVLHNPNADAGVQFPVVRVTTRDAGGHVLSTTDETYRRWLRPSDTSTLAVEVQTPGGVAKIDCQALDPGDKWRSISQMKAVPVGDLATANLEYGTSASGIEFKCDVGNLGQTGVDDYIVSVVLRDKAGRIVAGYFGIGENLDPRSRQSFQLPVAHGLPKYATAEAFAEIWGDN